MGDCSITVMDLVNQLSRVEMGDVTAYVIESSIAEAEATFCRHQVTPSRLLNTRV